MAYTKVSIPKKDGGAGAPVAKDPNVIFVLTKDVQTFPERDAGGVKSTAALVLKAEAKAFGIYCTPTTISRNDNSEGDPDKMGILQNFAGEHPGDEVEFAEWLQNNLNEDFLIITKECGDNKGTRLHGTPCNPMKMTFEEQDNNEAKFTTLTFASIQRSKFKSMHYTHDLPELYAPASSGSTGSAGSGI